MRRFTAIMACGLLGCVVSHPRESPENVQPVTEPTSGEDVSAAPALESDAGSASDSSEPREESLETRADETSSRGDFGVQLEALREKLRAFRDVSWLKASESAATVLESLAATLESLPVAATPRDRLLTVRAAADKLRGSESASLDSAQFIREGLAAAYSAIEQFVRQCELPSSHMHPWLDSAEQAVFAIDEKGLLTFQRATIQDAFRTTVDTLVVIGSIESKCGPALMRETDAGVAERES